MKTLENEHRDSFSASPLFEQSKALKLAVIPSLSRGVRGFKKSVDFIGSPAAANHHDDDHLSSASSVGEALRWGMTTLRSSSSSPRADANRLLEHVLGRTSAWLVAHDTEGLDPVERHGFVRVVKERARGVPVAYVLGRWGFFGSEYTVNADVLVPRPETELLVERALQFLMRRAGRLQVLDVGTGSGAIACAIAQALPNAIVHATDNNAAAIRLAQQNAARLGVQDRCTFFVGDLAAPVRGERYACVLANLPYIPTAELPRRPDPASYEPRGALDGGPDGLALYRRLLSELPSLLEDDALAVLEAAAPTIAALVDVARRYVVRADVDVARDYAGQERFVVVATGSSARSAE